MAYETASASGVNDLLGKLRVFAIAQGWNVDFYGTRGTSWATSQALMLNKGGLYYAIFTDATAGTASDPGNYFCAMQYPGPYVTIAADAATQANASTTTRCNNMSGPYEAYHFFAGTNETGQSYLHVVVEAVSGSFRHLGIGVLNKAGVITTGAYNYGCRWNYGNTYINSINSNQAIPWDGIETSNNTTNHGTQIRADSDTLSPRYYRCQQTVNTTHAYCGIFASYTVTGLALAPSTLTGRSILLPIIVQGARTAGYYSNLGGPPDIRFVNITNLLPGEIVTIGSDSWKTFPIIRKNGVAGLENTGVWGYAYRIVT